MTQLNHSASSSESTKAPTLRALPSPRPREFDELTPEVAKLICGLIRSEGIADHLAGALVFVNRAVFERWKAEDECFALALEEARAQFELSLLRTIRAARKSNGEPDWRAHVWLLKNATAEGIVKPARAVKLPTATVFAQKSANRPESPAAAAPTRATASENGAILPESTGRAGQPGGPAPLAGRISPDVKTPANLPETPRAQRVA